jgi:hypothetical protein
MSQFSSKVLPSLLTDRAQEVTADRAQEVIGVVEAVVSMGAEESFVRRLECLGNKVIRVVIPWNREPRTSFAEIRLQVCSQAGDANRCWAKTEPEDKGDPDMAWICMNRLRLRFRGGSDVWHLKLRCNRYSNLR